MKCRTSGAAKMFSIAKVEILDDASASGAEWSATPPSRAEPLTLAEIEAAHRAALEAIGWHVTREGDSEDDALCLYKRTKAGKLLKHPTVVLRCETTIWDLIATEGGMPVVPIRWVLVRDPEERFQPQAWLCTDLTRDPAQIVAWFVRRWSVEVTFQETRAHLGVETQRQWSDMAIARTTPCLLVLFSIVTLLAARLPARQRRRVAAAEWYPKPRPTFADALAAVRCVIWRERALATSPRRRPRTKPHFRLPAPWAYAICHAA